MNALKDGINKFVLNEQLWRGFMGGNVKMSITIRKEKKRRGFPAKISILSSNFLISGGTEFHALIIVGIKKDLYNFQLRSLLYNLIYYNFEKI